MPRIQLNIRPAQAWIDSQTSEYFKDFRRHQGFDRRRHGQKGHPFCIWLTGPLRCPRATLERESKKGKQEIPFIASSRPDPKTKTPGALLGMVSGGSPPARLLHQPSSGQRRFPKISSPDYELIDEFWPRQEGIEVQSDRWPSKRLRKLNRAEEASRRVKRRRDRLDDSTAARLFQWLWTGEPAEPRAL